MNSYEELGIPRAASPEQIRQAYKALARLLHPDQCSDRAVRHLAELQMKRLNEMAATLLDPAERLRYDAGLEDRTELVRRAPPPAAPGMGWSRWLPSNVWMWLALAAAGVTLSAWHLSQGAGEAGRAAQAREEAVRSTAARGTSVTTRRPAPRQDGASELLLAELRAARRELEQLRRENRASPAVRQPGFRLPDPPPEVGAPVSHPRQAPEALRPETAAPGGAPRGPARQFGGSWFYVPYGSQREAKGLYPPEYVELRLVEEGGRLRGRYRARYRVSDQAISPMVVFDFDGSLDGSAVTLPWRGAGGAFGEVTLKPVAEDRLEVGWRAHRLSQQVGLASGVAVLLREQER